MTLELDEAEARLVLDALQGHLPLLSATARRSAYAIQGRIDVGILEDSAVPLDISTS